MKPRVAIASIIFGEEDTPSAWYTHALEEMGLRGFYLGRVTPEEAKLVLSEFDALLLAGGADVHPRFYGQEKYEICWPSPEDRDVGEMALAKEFFASEKPLLAICRGIQVLNVALGGTLVQHVPALPGTYLCHSHQKTRHGVYLTQSGPLWDIFHKNYLRVNSTHHQAVDALGQGLTLAARSCDGVNEAVYGGVNTIGVQWHPERIMEEGMLPLWRWFTQKAQEAAGKRV